METQLYDRQQLLEDVWSSPVSHLTGRYGLSNAGLKKLCLRLQVPTPPRGYWAKLSAGKKVPAKLDLGQYTGASDHLVIPVRDHRLASVINLETDPANHIGVPARLKDPHPIIKLTQNAAQTAQLDQRDRPVICGRSIHLRVSHGMQARALVIADTLLKALEKRGYEIYLGDDGVALIFHGLKYRFEFYEACKRVRYQLTEADKRRLQSRSYFYPPTWTFIPSGMLILQTRGGYGPKVMDGKRKTVEDLLNAFLIRVATDGMAELRRNEAFLVKSAEFAKRHDVWRTSKERQDDERAKLETLEREAKRWKRAERLRDYLRAMSNAAATSDPQSAEKRALIEWGNAKADWLDPLVDRPDEILDFQMEEPH